MVIGGFSLCAVDGQRLAQTREGMLGALFYHGAMPPTESGTPWPAELPLQVHASEGDAWFDRDVGEQLSSAAPDGELFLYPGGHLFTDSSWHEYDEMSAQLVVERTLGFLGRWS